VDDFEAHRDHLRAVAYRMLGSADEADDAVQEAWLRLARTDTGDVENHRAWLTTVVARVCLDMLRSRSARREVRLDTYPDAHQDTVLPADRADAAGRTGGTDAAGSLGPEQEALLAESVGLALMVVLDTLNPAERLAFVLHDMFAVPFQQIAPVLDRSVPAVKMLASRARRRVRGRQTPQADPARRRRVVDAFLAASRDGDFAALLTLLDPAVTVRADAVASPTGTPDRISGAEAVARQALAFAHRARHARVALVAGAPVILVAPHGRLATAMTFTIADARIATIDIIAAPHDLAALADLAEPAEPADLAEPADDSP
jgi:RNA polymerase sigma factor (sigma-70 family)